jgi:hypothetical protein
MFERKFPNQFLQWKIMAFMKARKGMDRSAITNILAIGDS